MYYTRAAEHSDSDLALRPGLMLTFPPDATARYCGSNPGRESVGLPGHCEPCAQHGHVIAHPDYGCGDVGCVRDHDEPSEPHLATPAYSRPYIWVSAANQIAQVFQSALEDVRDATDADWAEVQETAKSPRPVVVLRDNGEIRAAATAILDVYHGRLGGSMGERARGNVKTFYSMTLKAAVMLQVLRGMGVKDNMEPTGAQWNMASIVANMLIDRVDEQPISQSVQDAVMAIRDNIALS